jgi:mannose-1-phosphate guanylyltransferase
MKCLNIPVVIAGGSGSRLWPLSRQAYPKQFLPLVDQGCTMLQATLLRLQQALPEAEAPIIICHASHRFIVA